MFENQTLKKQKRSAHLQMISAETAASTEWLNDYQIEFCDNEESFRLLQGEWNNLLDQAMRKSVFLKHQWMHTWWIIYGSRRSGSRLFILIARDAAHRLIGVLPLYLEIWGRQPFAFRVLRLLGTTNEAPEYLDAILYHRHGERILSTLLANLAGRRAEYDALELTDLSSDALLASHLNEWSKTLGGWYRRCPGSVCPYIRIAGDFDTYLQSLSAKHRSNLRRNSRQLAEQYQVVLEVAVTPDEVTKGLEELFVLHQKRWAEKKGTSQFDNELTRAFHRRLARNLAEEGAIVLYLLKCDGKTAAAFYRFLFDQRLFGYNTGLDPVLLKHSIGTVALGRIIKNCFDQNYREFDFLRGTEAYKFNWTKLAHQTVSCEVALSVYAKLYIGCRHFYRRLRTHLKSLLMWTQ